MSPISRPISPDFLICIGLDGRRDLRRLHYRRQRRIAQWEMGDRPRFSLFNSHKPWSVPDFRRTDTQYVDISYRPNGSAGAYTTVRVNPTSAGIFDWAK